MLMLKSVSPYKMAGQRREAGAASGREGKGFGVIPKLYHTLIYTSATVCRSRGGQPCFWHSQLKCLLKFAFINYIYIYTYLHIDVYLNILTIYICIYICMHMFIWDYIHILYIYIYIFLCKCKCSLENNPFLAKPSHRSHPRRRKLLLMRPSQNRGMWQGQS